MHVAWLGLDSRLQAKISYFARIHPGGSIPAYLIRAVSKREYPKMVQRLSDSAVKTYAARPLKV